MKARKKRILWMVIVGFLVFMGAPVVLIGQQLRQNSLDHALIQAVKKLDAPTVNRLLSEGASANARDTDEPPLTVSRLWHRLRARFQHNRVGVEDRSRMSVLARCLTGNDLCCEESKTVVDAIAVTLIRHGANFNVRNDRQETPLHIAAYCGLHHTLRLLLSRGADYDARDSSGRTALMLADAEGTELLIEHGVDVNAPLVGATPVMYALSDGKFKAAQVLILHGAQVNATDRDGFSNLYHAQVLTAEGPGRTAIIRLLRQHRARLNQKDKEAIARDTTHARW